MLGEKVNDTTANPTTPLLAHNSSPDSLDRKEENPLPSNSPAQSHSNNKDTTVENSPDYLKKAFMLGLAGTFLRPGWAAPISYLASLSTSMTPALEVVMVTSLILEAAYCVLDCESCAAKKRRSNPTECQTPIGRCGTFITLYLQEKRRLELEGTLPPPPAATALK